MSEVVKYEPGAQAPAAPAENSKDRFDTVARRAMAMAKATVIPRSYQNNPGNCMIAMEFADRMGVPTLAVMQNLHVIDGRPSWASAFLIAGINQCGRFSPIRYRFSGEGDDYGCHAEAVDRETGEVLTGTRITRAMAKAEGWWDKRGSKWKTMPDQMFRYRAAAFWARVYAPELTVGLLTQEEAEDIRPRRSAHAQSVAAALDSEDVISAEEIPDEGYAGGVAEARPIREVLIEVASERQDQIPEDRTEAIRRAISAGDEQAMQDEIDWLDQNTTEEDE